MTPKAQVEAIKLLLAWTEAGKRFIDTDVFDSTYGEIRVLIEQTERFLGNE